MTERPNAGGGAEGALASLRRNGAGRSRGPTMTEVAAEAGVSQTTVSLVLNDAQGARLSSETRERVFEAAGRLGYRLARRGAPAQSTIGATAIGFVVNEMSTDPWTAIAMDGARDKAWEHGLTISAAVTRGDAEMEQAVLAQMTAQPLLGLIYGTIHSAQLLRPGPLAAIGHSRRNRRRRYRDAPPHPRRSPPDRLYQRRSADGRFARSPQGLSSRARLGRPAL
jgi:LacI family transcriptional regulator